MSVLCIFEFDSLLSYLLPPSLPSLPPFLVRSTLSPSSGRRTSTTPCFAPGSRCWVRREGGREGGKEEGHHLFTCTTSFHLLYPFTSGALLENETLTEGLHLALPPSLGGLKGGMGGRALKVQRNGGGGGSFACHYDNPGRPNKRRLTCLLYLNPQW